MALGDYILCCKCEVKLIYDGDRGQREWWRDRWGTEPKIKCPDCEPPAQLTEEEIEVLQAKYAPPVHPDFSETDDWMAFARAIERAHGIT